MAASPPRIGRSSGTADLGPFSDAVRDAYFPHRLSVRTDERCTRQLRSVDLGPVRLARIGWGAEVSVESDHPGAWAVNVPTTGVLEARVGGRQVVSLHGQASVFPPDQHIVMTRWSADCAIIGMRVERDYLDQEVAALVGLPARRLPRQIDLRTDTGRAWKSLVTAIGSEAMMNPALYRDAAVGRRLAAALTAALVTACLPDEPPSGTMKPRLVSRVLDAMEADPSHDWTASEIAELSGVGIRRVQQGFRRYLGRTPMQVLRDIRLERVHADLLADGGGTVAEIASRWGVTHLGRFAAAYRERYGCAPSRTLRG